MSEYEQQPKVKVALANGGELELVLCGDGQIVAQTPYDHDKNYYGYLTVNRVRVIVRIVFTRGEDGWDVDRYSQGGLRDVTIKRADEWRRAKGGDRVSEITWDKTLELVTDGVKRFASDNRRLLMLAERISLTSKRLSKEADIKAKQEELNILRFDLSNLIERERQAAKDADDEGGL